jgi:hypothetical protein
MTLLMESKLRIEADELQKIVNWIGVIVVVVELRLST